MPTMRPFQNWRLILVAAVGIVACARPMEPPGIPWSDAPTPGRPVIYKFSTQWCPYCARLDETVFVNPRVVALAGEFSMVLIDGDNSSSDALMKKYGVMGYPTVVFTQPDGRVIVTTHDDPDPDHFLELMQMALGRADPARRAALDAIQKEAELPLVSLDKGKAARSTGEQRRIWEEGIRLCREYLRTPREVSVTRYEMAPDYLEAMADLYTALGRDDAAMQTRSYGASMLMGRIRDAPQPAKVKSLLSPTIVMLIEGRRYKEARELAGIAINTFPKEYLYHKRLADVHVASLEGDYSRGRIVNKALHEYELAMATGYGRNLLKTADAYSDLLIRLNRLGEAGVVIRKALTAVDWSTNTREKELRLKTKLEDKLR